MNTSGPASAARPPLVLLVDDNPDTLEMYALGLQYEGFDVVTARDGGNALQLVAARHPDCIVTDVRMPSMTGFEFRRLLARSPETAGIPVIALTGYVTPAAVEAGGMGEFASVLVKPCLPEVLGREIVGVLTAGRQAAGRASNGTARATRVRARAARAQSPARHEPRAD